MKPLKVGYMCVEDPWNPYNFSGTHLSMISALQGEGLETTHLGPSTPPRVRSLLSRGLRKLGFDRPPAVPAVGEQTAQSKALGRQVAAQLAEAPCDVIFAPLAMMQLAFLETDVPVVYLSDATARLVNYPSFTKLPPEVRREQEDLEQAAILRADRLVYPSRWVAESAIQDYGADRSRVHVVPLGANVDDVPPSQFVDARRPGGPCRMVFLGKEFGRKGGSLALETLTALRGRGLDTRLAVITAEPPPAGPLPAGVDWVGYIDKSKAAHRERFGQILRDAHFLILPTRADFSPHALCEAAAFGLPSLATAVGGIPELVEDGQTGLLLPLEARGEDYARLIAAVYGDPPRYAQMARAARARFDTRLNWRAWAAEVHGALRQAAECVASPAGGQP